MLVLDTTRDSAEAVAESLGHAAEASQGEVEETVARIISEVRIRGDLAVIEYTRRFDFEQADLDHLLVSDEAIEAAEEGLDSELRRAMLRACGNISQFHARELDHLRSWEWGEEGVDDVALGQVIHPVDRAGFYIPGGRAAYPSTVLMTIIPADVAGVGDMVICTPPDSTGAISPMVAAAISLTRAWQQGKCRVFGVGGAQAVAAMAYGTDTIPAVDLIAGPGNTYVNTAKRFVYGKVGIDMPAGPSEVAVVADDGADPSLIAADLLAQTEHGPDNRGFLFSPSNAVIASVEVELEKQRKLLKRQEILALSAKNLVLIKTVSIDEAIALSNRLAPEHLELHVQSPRDILPKVRNAGAVLLGRYTSAPVGDYIAGPSHTLPTSGAARFSSPLSAATFLKRTNIISYSRGAAAAVAGDVALLAQAEGFDGHAAAATVRRTMP